MDTVISAGDSRKVLLTFHFVKYHFQLAYILESKEVINVTACINDLCNRIGLANFQKMFEVILTDNGTEFSDPESIEFEPENGELSVRYSIVILMPQGKKDIVKRIMNTLDMFYPKEQYLIS